MIENEFNEYPLTLQPFKVDDNTLPSPVENN